jgi:hypothetical protein
MHTRRAIHIPHNLHFSDTDPIHARRRSILDITELEPGAYVRRQALGVHPVHELERVLVPELHGDAVRRVRVCLLELESRQRVNSLNRVIAS